MAQDFTAYNARKPVAHVRFVNVDEWALVVSAAARRGLTVNAYLRTVAIEAAHDGNQSSNSKTYRTLAST